MSKSMLAAVYAAAHGTSHDAPEAAPTPSADCEDHMAKNKYAADDLELVQMVDHADIDRQKRSAFWRQQYTKMRRSDFVTADAYAERMEDNLLAFQRHRRGGISMLNAIGGKAPAEAASLPPLDASPDLDLSRSGAVDGNEQSFLAEMRAQGLTHEQVTDRLVQRWRGSPALQSEFEDGKIYAGFMIGVMEGRVRILKSK